jgi:pimeloyl-ACP methyl ester carboxylesterase
MHAIVSGDLEADPTILFVHANGFNARTYLPLLQPLASTYDVMSLDMRGHGRTDLPTQERGRNWYVFREDLIKVLSGFSTPPVLIGHSMGGTVSVLAAAKRPDLVSRVIAFDPPILPRLLQWGMRIGLISMRSREKHPLVRGALSRRREFGSREAAFQRYAGRRPFISWQDGFLQNYLADGLRQHGEQVELSCHPAWEAHNYTAHGHDVWGALRRLKTPALLIGGDGPGVVLRNKTLSRLGALNTQIQTRHVDGSSHFLPMENPDLAQSLIRNFIKGQT